MKKTSVIRIAVFAIFCVFLSRRAEACAIPVFRYALERWEPYAYEAVVFHKGPLPADLKKAIDGLEEGNANLAVWQADVNEELPEELKAFWEERKDKVQLPWISLRFPYAFWEKLKQNVVWEGPFSKESLAKMIDSPMRTRIASHILKGVSAVWVVIEGENGKENDLRANMLDGHLTLIEKEIQLPQESYDEVNQGEMAGRIPLKIDFEVMRLSRDNKEEEVFLEMLLKTEVDGKKIKDKPIAIPIIGQGRSVWGLIGEGINTNMIEAACAFMLGFCSCEIKDLNPGVDMLMNVNWYSAVTNLYSVPSEIPELRGVGSHEQQVAEEKEQGPRKVYRLVGMAFFALLVVVALVSAFVARRKGE